jgi:hypothetical protein
MTSSTVQLRPTTIKASAHKYESTFRYSEPYELPSPHWSHGPRRLESLKEFEALRVMSADGIPVISHDDALCIRLMKSSKLLAPDWRKHTDFHYTHDGSRRILCYFNTLTKERYAPDDIIPHDLLPVIRPKFDRALYLNSDVDVLFHDAYIDFVIRGWDDYRRRHELVNDVFVEVAERGLLTAEATRESIKRDVLPHLRIARYEFDWILKGRIGSLLYSSLVQHDKSRVLSQEVFPGMYITWGYAITEEGTIYLDWSKYNGKTAMMKVYPLDFCGGLCLPYYKIEVALNTPYFRSHDISVSDLTTHPQMQSRFRKDLAHHLRRALCEPFTVTFFRKALDLSRCDEVIPSLLSPELSLTNRISRKQYKRVLVERQKGTTKAEDEEGLLETILRRLEAADAESEEEGEEVSRLKVRINEAIASRRRGRGGQTDQGAGGRRSMGSS